MPPFPCTEGDPKNYFNLPSLGQSFFIRLFAYFFLLKHEHVLIRIQDCE